MLKYNIVLAALSTILFCCCQCTKSSTTPTPTPTPTPTGHAIEYWFTKADQSAKLQKQTEALNFSGTTATGVVIIVDSTTTFQSIDGFGYTLTGGSATLINNLPASIKSNLLQELFGNSENSLGISYLRVSIGASDLDANVFSYNDLPAGQTDPNLNNFSLAQDTVDLIPILQQILAINPNIKILGSPWSAPVWMKSNNSSIGGSLLPQYYPSYANYFKKYIQAMQAKGIRIDAITIQNEPENPNNNPSLVMTAQEQADFIKNHLGPTFQAAGINTKIQLFDHNCDHPEYPISILNDAAAKQYVDGSAFHLYLGEVSALSVVHNAHPDKNIYFTEQWTGSNGTFDGDLQWHIKNVIIGTMRNWSKNALEWNLANDPSFGPHTPGGCTQCKGALTINGTSIERNVSYYIIGHASKFVVPGSKRISSSNNSLSTVAFLRPDGKKVLIVLNEGTNAQGFSISANGKAANATIPAKTVGTYIW